MQFLRTSVLLFGLLFTAAEASPVKSERAILAYRAWDIRFYSDSVPTCNPDDPNENLTIAHTYGARGRTCQDFGDWIPDTTAIKSISWKSPSESDWWDLCTYSTADCSGGSNGGISDGWEVCYPYSGFLGWTVVPHGTACD